MFFTFKESTYHQKEETYLLLVLEKTSQDSSFHQPSKGEVFSNFLHYHQDENLTVGSSADVVMNTMTVFGKARIPIITREHSNAKLQNLKGRKRRSPCQIQMSYQP